MPLYIAEYRELARSRDWGSTAQTVQAPAITTQEVAIGAGNAQSAALNTDTRFIELTCDANCHVAVGANPDGTNVGTRFRMAAGSNRILGAVGSVAGGLKVGVAT